MKMWVIDIILYKDKMWAESLFQDILEMLQQVNTLKGYSKKDLAIKTNSGLILFIDSRYQGKRINAQSIYIQNCISLHELFEFGRFFRAFTNNYYVIENAFDLVFRRSAIDYIRNKMRYKAWKEQETKDEEETTTLSEGRKE